MVHDFCVFLAPRISEQKCSFQKEAKIISEKIALEDKIAEVFRN